MSEPTLEQIAQCDVTLLSSSDRRSLSILGTTCSILARELLALREQNAIYAGFLHTLRGRLDALEAPRSQGDESNESWTSADRSNSEGRSLGSQGDAAGDVGAGPYANSVLMRMSPYECANLLSLLQTITGPGAPLRGLDTGDWCGQLRYMLEPLSDGWPGPNCTPQQNADRVTAALDTGAS